MQVRKIAAKDLSPEVLGEISQQLDCGDDDPIAQLSDGTPVYFDITETPYIISNGEVMELMPEEIIEFPLE